MLLNSKIYGDGSRNIIVLHGFLGMSDNWKSFAIEIIKKKFKVHLIDQRNHGKSFHSNEFNYKILAEDLKFYTDYHKIKSFSLIGHSMGGKTLMHLACEFPQYIHAFVVADIAPKTYSPHHQMILNGLSHLDFNQIKTRGDADNALAAYVKDSGTRLFLLKNLYWESKGKLGLRINIDVLTNVNEAIGQGLLPDARSSHPCLFIKGEKSDYILENDTPIIKHHFPNAEQMTVPNAGHWLHAENPTFFFKAVTDWLQKQ